MSLILIGVNHRTAPVEIRERLSISEAEATRLLKEISARPDATGVSILSTCNRVEILLSASNEEIVDPRVELLAGRSKLSRADIERHLYVLRHADVVRHLFRVASGLDSMIVGEPQIGGQVRAAYANAQAARSLDALLQRLLETTLRVSKKIRTETGIGEHAVSVPFAAVELARKIFGELDHLEVLLIGAGEMGELTAEHLQAYGVRSVFVANRAFERAQDLARRFSGEAIQFDQLAEKLRTADIVIASTSAPHYVVERSDVQTALGSQKRRNLFLIDLSVPRNLDPAIGEVEGAYLYNVDDLQEVVDQNREKRLEKARRAEEIVERELDGFLRRLLSHEAVPTIVELQSRLDEIRLTELEKCLRRLGPITTEQRAAIEALTSGIINKVLHYPILRLKESAADPAAAAPDRDRLRETIRKIFGLR
jgi:glutamyl-tRNA reductase